MEGSGFETAAELYNSVRSVSNPRRVSVTVPGPMLATAPTWRFAIFSLINTDDLAKGCSTGALRLALPRETIGWLA